MSTKRRPIVRSQWARLGLDPAITSAPLCGLDRVLAAGAHALPPFCLPWNISDRRAHTTLHANAVHLLLFLTSVGRGGLSILSAVGLQELLASSREQYVDIAIHLLAADLDRLAELRRSMRQRMQSSPLMDAKSFARDVEEIYRELWRRWCAAKTSA